MKNNILLKIILKDLQKLNEKKNSDGMRSVKKGADNNPKVTKMDFLPNKVLNKIAKSKDETLEDVLESFIQLQENPKSNHHPNYKAPEGSERDKKLDKFKEMLKKAKELIKQGKTKQANKLKQRVYDGRDKMEKKERDKKKNESLSVSRYQLNELISEAVEAKKLAIMLEKVEELEEKKKRKKSKKKKKKGGGLSAAVKKSLDKKADKRGFTRGSVYTEFRKGLAAYYSSGSRKGMSAHQWAHARVNSANPSKSWASVKKRKGGKKKKKK